MIGGAAPRAAAGGGTAWRVERFEAIDSTNEEGRRRLLVGDPGRLWIIAETQSAGRGRRGRSWQSLPGNLYASALLVEPCPPAIAPQIGFVAGVALVRAAQDVGARGAKLKWPNDLLGDGAKLAGLLVEGLFLPGRGFACVVGVGVNCVSSPLGLAYPTTTLAALCGRPVGAAELFSALAARFAEALETWRGGRCFADIRAAWLAEAAGLGGRIRVEDARGAREGVFTGLDVAGRLLFRGDAGLETIEAADFFLAPPPAEAPRCASTID